MIREILELSRPSWKLLLLSITTGAISGFSISALLALTNKIINADLGMPINLVILFFSLCLLALATDVASDISLNVIGQRIVGSIRSQLCRTILQAPISEIELQKPHRLITILHQDVSAITSLFLNLPRVAINIPIIIGCLSYLAFLSLEALAIVLVAIAIGVGLHALARRRALQKFQVARNATDDLQQHFQAITYGAKELRLNRRRRARFFNEQFAHTIDLIRSMTVQANNTHATADAFGSLLFFILIGIILALSMGAHRLDGQVTSGFVIVLLYMRGPIGQLISVLPVLGNAQVSLARVQKLRSSLGEGEFVVGVDERPPARWDFERIELRGVTYAYPSEDGGEPFSVGPIDLTIRRGEILFITGGNGSGKTTLIKLLLGLYRPGTGEILIDDQPLRLDDRDDYRQLFSAVFSDYHLFSDLVPGDGVRDPDLQDYLRRVRIQDKIAIEGRVLSTTELSTGQRKRLALVHAYAEARPILLFDEWAADQDPHFRTVFYREILPELQRQGRTIIAITHDDRYFDVADHHVKLENGKIIEDKSWTSSCELQHQS